MYLILAFHWLGHTHARHPTAPRPPVIIPRGSKGMLLIVPLIFLVELAGVFIKPAALAIRLYANMLGGHILMATLLLFGIQAFNAGLSPVGWISIRSGPVPGELVDTPP